MAVPEPGSIVHILAVSEPACTGPVLDEIDAVFFATGATQAFVDETARIAFHDRWLGRYLSHWPDWCFAALNPDNAVAGYVAGCPFDPARSALFSDHGYTPLFAQACGRYPAHLHINVASGLRGGGIGSALISAFAARCIDAGIAGCHAITADGHRNNGFFEAQGFHAEARSVWNDRPLVFYARDL